MDDRAAATAWLAAGLVWLGSDDPGLEAELIRILEPQVWWRADRPRLAKPQGVVEGDEPKAAWRNPGAMSEEDVAGYAAAWQRVTERLGAADFLRVSVFTLDDRRAAMEIGEAAGVRVSPTLSPIDEGDFTWHCPVRVTVGGERMADRLAELSDLPLAGEYFVVAPDGPADVCLLDGAEPAPLGCGTVIAVGAADALQLLGRAAASGRVLAVGVPRDDLSWWPEVVRALAANLPLDCALVSAVPDSLVGGVIEALTATTLDLSHDAQGWHGPTTTATFLGVGGGRGAGPETTAEPPPTTNGEPPAVTPDPRRLVVEFRDGRRRLRTVLPPQRQLTLEVSIAVPAKGQPAGSVPIEAPPDAEEVVTLDVVADSELWPEPQQAQLVWPVHDHTQPSTSAVFALTTPDAGRAVAITITVLYRGRQLQRAVVTAAVREAAVPGERVRVLVQRTSTPPQPALLTTAAEVSLDATGSELRNLVSGAAIPLSRIEGTLDAFERRLSRTLGVDDAPESLSDPVALALLVDLARQGSGLRDQLAGLGLDGAGAISLLVQPASRLLPLELVYTGQPPRRTGVKLCDHVDQPPPPGQACDRASSRVVCPYAFWALTRTIARTVLVPGDRALPAPARLDLQPVLYAASDRADYGADPAARPTEVLARAVAELFGADQVGRVTSWTAWRREVATRQPELLLLLAHTETDAGEASLQIGRKSFLARPDISAALVGRAPLVLLVACASAVAGDEFGTLAGTFTARGAAAVVGLLTKLSGSQGARAAAATLTALLAAGRAEADGRGLGLALAQARRDLVSQGLLVGMMLVAHGEIDVEVG